MAQNTSYPSPTSAQMGDGPFYTTRQNQLPVAADAQISPQMPPRAPPAAMVRDSTADENAQKAQIAQNAQNLRHPPLPSSEELARHTLEHQYDQMSESARKRTKVSRACDECRRKKIRCDADSEAPGAQCSSCKRSDMLCMFSRAPQKRGPSKGYIKELAERVGALEGRRMVPPMTGYQYPGYNEYSPQPEELGYGQRKRTHSMSEGPQTSPYMQDTNQGSLARDSIGRYPPAPVDWSGRDGGETSRNATQSSPTFPNASNLMSPNTPTPLQRQENSQVMEVTNSVGSRQNNDPTDFSLEWNDYAFGEYYRLIHATHPLLADTKLQVLLNLDKVIDAVVRDAFFASLQVLVKSITPGSTSQQQDVRAAELLMSLNFKDAATRTATDNLVYLQAILLMALATDMSGPAISQQPIWYNLAGIMADFLGLGNGPPYRQNTDPEIEYSKLARRAWLVFITLDRWHASGTLSRSIMPEDVTLFPHDDHTLLGDNGFHLLRLSLILGHVADAIRYPPEASLKSPFRFSLKVLNGELERFREEIEPMFSSLPHVHLSFLHVKHLLKRGLSHHFYEADGLVHIALEIVDIVTGDQLLMSPLTHHFASLAAVTLVESTQETLKPSTPPPGTVLGCLHHLRQWLDKDNNPLAVTPESGKQGWNTVIAHFIATNVSKSNSPLGSSNNNSSGTLVDRGGLQHLAEAAVGSVESMNGEKGPEEGKQVSAEGDNLMDLTTSTTTTVTTTNTAKGYLQFIRYIHRMHEVGK